MSVWSQVAMIFRINYIKWNGEGELDFETIFGKRVSFDGLGETVTWEEIEAHPEKYLPMGSEGSLDISVWENRTDEYCADRYVVSIFGSLRDHEEEDVENLIKWFDEKCKDKRISIKQAVINIDNNWVGDITKTYKPY